jgi:Fe-S-cluster containining protein
MDDQIDLIPVNELMQAAQRPEVITAMGGFYDYLDGRIASYQPKCTNRGFCCKFGEFGHRLYVTALEACYYLDGEYEHLPIKADACPLAYNYVCNARDHRPMGCRIFFCDGDVDKWQGALTEECLGHLRDMHNKFGLSYFYMDWMHILKAIERHGLTASDKD